MEKPHICIVKCSDSALQVAVISDTSKQIKEVIKTKVSGQTALWYKDCELVYSEECASSQDAIDARVKALKEMTQKEKLKLIAEYKKNR